ncbi:hypothetical protein OESDEN_07289 [Oesophagostomum dentatum]|uniref:Helicase ATP-binding domain-containing protein n=1 Tax=Oesophagostomum dentatum TaxID=61180 RepID=A0A0B1TAH0_OESDE|nr:hypothetical protein OESDEN_07289 [Oesophagostomum dentatum]
MFSLRNTTVLDRVCSAICFSRAHLHITHNTASIGRYAKLQKRKDPLAAYPPEFRAKLREWPRLLQAEIDESVAHLKQLKQLTGFRELEERGLLIANLRLLSDDLHPLTGRTVLLKRVGAQGADRSKVFRRGAPLTIREAGSLKEIAECVMLSSNRKEIMVLLIFQTLPKFGLFYSPSFKVKIRQSSASRSLNGDTDYVITLSQSSGALHSVQDFFLQNKVVDTPGINLLGYAFRAMNMPSVHNDRMLSDLPEELNESQRRAVSAALNKRRPFVTIQGPPGTGKTKVVAEIVRQLYRKKLKTLVCAPSHVAVDRVMSEVSKFFTEQRDDEEISCDETDRVIADAETIEDAIVTHEKYTDLCNLFDQMNDLSNMEEKGKLRTDANKLKWKILKDAYKKRLVIFCTLSSSAIQRLAQVSWHPDVIIIDEAAQASEPFAWAAIVQAKRALRGNLHVSLMERLVSEFSKANVNQLLTVQYRMNERIMQWSSREFYDSRLVASEDVAKINLSDISFVSSCSRINSPLVMLNTDLSRRSTDNFREVQSQMSYRNPGEAELVLRYVQILRSLGVPSNEIAVISPYYAQVAVLREMLGGTDVSANTVDSFQGQEREVVVFSMVRHNEEKSIGFLQNEKRLNVAITRSKRQFVLIGSAHMMKNNRHLRSLLRTIQSVGKVYGPGVLEEFEKGKSVAAIVWIEKNILFVMTFDAFE